MTDPALTQGIKKSRRQMVLMFAIGLVPVLVAYVVYTYFPQLMPTATTNVGTFILPPIQSEEVKVNPLDGQWTLILPLIGDCDDSCEQRLYFARQVDTALGKESDRVGRILVADWRANPNAIDQLMSTHLGMQLQQIDIQVLQFELEKALKRALENASESGAFHGGVMDTRIDQYIFVMDPIGNIMMFYTIDQAGKGMLKDLKHLLKVSNIG